MEILIILGLIGVCICFWILIRCGKDAQEDVENWRETNYFGDRK